MEHSFDYNLVCKIETAEAKVQKLYEKGICKHEQSSVTLILPFWWADNFNLTVEFSTGYRVMNSIHIVGFS